MEAYTSMCRSNYFSVTDRKKFDEIMETVIAQDTVFTWDREDGKVSFGCYDEIVGFYCDEEDEDSEICYDTFLYKLQEVLCEDDAIIIITIGNEKLRHIYGDSIVITKKEIKIFNLEETAVAEARELLNQPNWPEHP